MTYMVYDKLSTNVQCGIRTFIIVNTTHFHYISYILTFYNVALLSHTNFRAYSLVKFNLKFNLVHSISSPIT